MVLVCIDMCKQMDLNRERPAACMIWCLNKCLYWCDIGGGGGGGLFRLLGLDLVEVVLCPAIKTKAKCLHYFTRTVFCFFTRLSETFQTAPHLKCQKNIIVIIRHVRNPKYCNLLHKLFDRSFGIMNTVSPLHRAHVVSSRKKKREIPSLTSAGRRLAALLREPHHAGVLTRLLAFISPSSSGRNVRRVTWVHRRGPFSLVLMNRLVLKAFFPPPFLFLNIYKYCYGHYNTVQCIVGSFPSGNKKNNKNNKGFSALRWPPGLLPRVPGNCKRHPGEAPPPLRARLELCVEERKKKMARHSQISGRGGHLAKMCGARHVKGSYAT